MNIDICNTFEVYFQIFRNFGYKELKNSDWETKSGLNVSQQCHLSLSENGKWQICFPRVRRWSPRRCRITLQMSLMSAKQHPWESEFFNLIYL